MDSHGDSQSKNAPRRLLKNTGHSPALRDCATGNRKLLKKWHRLQPVARKAQVAKGFFSNLLVAEPCNLAPECSIQRGLVLFSDAGLTANIDKIVHVNLPCWSGTDCALSGEFASD